MNTFQLYSNWHRALAQTIPDRCPSRLKNLTGLVVGLYLAMNVQLSGLVRQWPLTAKNASLTRRLERFLNNPAYTSSGDRCAESVILPGTMTDERPENVHGAPFVQTYGPAVPSRPGAAGGAVPRGVPGPLTNSSGAW